MDTISSPKKKRRSRVICTQFPEDLYPDIVRDPKRFREHLLEQIALHPELFPPEIKQGFLMKDQHESARLGMTIRRIKVNGLTYTVRPSFVTPYLTGLVSDVENALFFRKFSVPFWALAHAFGKNPMYWYRLELSVGRHELVGTTVRHAEDLPDHLGADEKHTRIVGSKVYVASTCGGGCILGAAIAQNAGEAALTKAYEVFKTEAENVKSAYAPKTVNTDGWPATQKAWRTLFCGVILIACFLHVYIKLRDRSKIKFKEWFQDVSNRLWQCYRATSKASFAQRLRRMHEWAISVDGLPDFMLEKIKKLRENAASFSIYYDYPGALRTSNMIDRLMQRMDRHLFCTQYFHGGLVAAEYSIRGWALIQNFAPCSPYNVKRHEGFKSPAERLNRFRYHDNWLQNLLISGSLKGGVKVAPLNPV